MKWFTHFFDEWLIGDFNTVADYQRTLAPALQEILVFPGHGTGVILRPAQALAFVAYFSLVGTKVLGDIKVDYASNCTLFSTGHATFIQETTERPSGRCVCWSFPRTPSL
jgi:hypothetical protein